MIKKLPSTDSFDEFYWVAHPGLEYGTRGEKEDYLIKNRDKIELLGGVTDDEASYSYDEWALIRLEGKHYLLSTSGCSCPSPSDTWFINLGPVTLEEIKNHVINGDYDGYTVPGRQLRDFLAIFDEYGVK